MENRHPACDGKRASSLFPGGGAVPELRRRQAGWLSSPNLTRMPVGAYSGGIELAHYFVNKEAVY
jgi:hypothetical protein